MVIALTTLFRPLVTIAQNGSPEKWKVKMSLGISIDKGNSDTMDINSDLKCARETKKRIWEVLGDIDYGKSSEKTETQDAEISLDYKRKFNLNYLKIKTELFHDRIANTDARTTTSVAPGRFFAKSEKATFNIDAGPAYVGESRTNGDREEFMGISAYENLEYSFSDSFRCLQYLKYMHNIKDGDHYLLETKVSVENDINTHFSLRISLKNSYDNRPPADTKKNDTKFTTSLVYKM